jgi:predicted RNA binding protein YcfA (HicA-like mRNA interferase family)
LSRLPVVSGPEAVRALRRAGLAFDRQSGGHVILVHPSSQQTVAVPIHGGRDLKPGTLRGILRDAGLTVEEFVALLR